jgi:hypothetical protein
MCKPADALCLYVRRGWRTPTFCFAAKLGESRGKPADKLEYNTGTIVALRNSGHVLTEHYTHQLFAYLALAHLWPALEAAPAMQAIVPNAHPSNAMHTRLGFATLRYHHCLPWSLYDETLALGRVWLVTRFLAREDRHLGRDIWHYVGSLVFPVMFDIFHHTRPISKARSTYFFIHMG